MSEVAAEPRWHRRLAPLLLFVALAAASISPIWSNDYFWHLAAGRWIVEHRSLPETDALAVASDRGRWVNGEWLFQVGVYALYRAAGHDGVTLTRAVGVAAVFTLLFVLSRRQI